MWWWIAGAVAQSVSGGQAPDLNAQTFRATVDAGSTLWTDAARRGPDGQPVGRMLLHYTDDPLVYERQDGDVTKLVASVVQADLVGSFAFGRARVGAVVPIYLLASGDQQQGSGLGDLAVDGKVTLLDGEDAPVDVATGLRVTLPTTTVDVALGEGAVGWELTAIASRELGPVVLAANAGLRSGPSTSLEDYEAVAELGDFVLGRAAVGYAFTQDVGATAELTGRATLVAGNGLGAPIEWLVGGYGRPTESLVVRGGVGSGMTSGVGSPDVRLVVGVGWEPGTARAHKDTDLDGITDDVDACVEEPEDADGFDDTDGCPDIDNDGDGIVDAADACPLEPEDADGHLDDDGCADPGIDVVWRVVDESGVPIELAKVTVSIGDGVVMAGGNEVGDTLEAGVYIVEATAGTYEPVDATFELVEGPPVEHTVTLAKKKNVKVVVSRDRIELQDTVNFETGRAVIKSDSFGLLDQAVQILVDYPEIERLRIEGHTDSRGSASYNEKLSAARAASVMQYFVDKGVDEGRLQSVGFGESRPLDPAKTEEAYAKNRRVDFFIETWNEANGQKVIEVAPE
jgi:outer membrane protein OmpA-like peptidoglycan-associated protein